MTFQIHNITTNRRQAMHSHFADPGLLRGRGSRYTESQAGEEGDKKKGSTLKMASPVWEFYNVSEKDNKFAVCKVCAKEIPRGGMIQNISTQPT